MTKKHKPRSGSLAFYPRKRAKRETASFRTFPAFKGDGSKPLNFLGYKAGMFHMVARNDHEGAVSYGQDIFVPASAIECPPLKVYGIRAYENTPYGLKIIAEASTEKPEKHLGRKMKSFKKKHRKEGKKAEGSGKKTIASIDDIENKIGRISEIRLLVHTQPYLTGIGKKKPEIAEIKLSGSTDAQMQYAKEKFGREIKVGEVFKEKQFVDVKAVDKGKGFCGVVKRFGIKIQRPKAKKHRVVGSIGPWNPSTVMWTVARAGQLGYQTRTEYNKRLLQIGEDASELNPGEGFKNYGMLKNDFVILAGSVPGPAKRSIALREPVRLAPERKFNVGDVSFVSTAGAKKKAKEEAFEEEGGTKAKKMVSEKEAGKKEEKSVSDEIAAAVKGEKEKKEKHK